MNTAYRECEQRKNECMGCGRMRSRAHGASPLAKCQLPAKNGDFWDCWYVLEEIRLQRIVLCEETGFYVFLKYIYGIFI